MSKKSSADESITGLARTTRGSPARAGFGPFGQRNPIPTSAVESTERIAERTWSAHQTRFSSIISCFCAGHGHVVGLAVPGRDHSGAEVERWRRFAVELLGDELVAPDVSSGAPIEFIAWIRAIQKRR